MRARDRETANIFVYLARYVTRKRREITFFTAGGFRGAVSRGIARAHCSDGSGERGTSSVERRKAREICVLIEFREARARLVK